MKTVVLVVVFVVMIHSELVAQVSTSSGLYKPGNPPQCNIPFSREFLGFTEEIARHFTEKNPNLQLLLPDDFISTWADGEVLNKKRFLSLRANPDLQVKRIHFVRDKSYNVCLYGYIAVVTGMYVLDATIKDRDLTGQYRFTAVYEKRPGKWRLIALHSSRLARPMQLEH